MPGSLEQEFNPPGLDRVDHPLLDEYGISLNMLRLDQVHPLINGNKWFKLAENLTAIQESGHETVLSFGGAWSNHLVALAAAGRLLGFNTIGLVRGEIREPLNPVLAFLREQGMQLVPISREDYRKKNEPDFLAGLNQRFEKHFLLPEGGSNRQAVAGCRLITDYIHWSDEQRDSGAGAVQRLVVAACGTGATLAGVILGLAGQAGRHGYPRVRGISVLKAPGYLQAEVSGWLQQFACEPTLDWSVLDDYHCGGYARIDDELLEFMAEFSGHCAIPIEPVYTGKMLYGLFRQIAGGAIAPGCEVVALHSGGLLPTKSY
jgi:1-aminocyclopropane-1-carboxylate deaminase